MRPSLVFPILVLSACTSSQLTGPGSQVSIVSAVPPDQAGRYQDLGAVVVQQPSQFRGDEEDARNQLRNYAARDGAELILLQSVGREPCEVNKDERCVFLRGRKLRRADTMDRPSGNL